MGSVLYKEAGSKGGVGSMELMLFRWPGWRCCTLTMTLLRSPLTLLTFHELADLVVFDHPGGPFSASGSPICKDLACLAGQTRVLTLCWCYNHQNCIAKMVLMEGTSIWGCRNPQVCTHQAQRHAGAALCTICGFYEV